MNEEILEAKVRSMRSGEWFWVHHQVLDRYGTQLGPYGIAVYAALCRFASQQQMAFPSQKLIAEKIGASRSKVSRELNRSSPRIDHVISLARCGLPQNSVSVYWVHPQEL